MRTALFALAALLMTPPALAQPDLEPIPASETPPNVLAQTDCDENGGDQDTVMRDRVFGAVVFRIRCPGNNANFVEALVLADDPSGRNARLMRFPSAERGVTLPEISNVRLFASARAIGSIDVDAEDGLAIRGVCRQEMLWRLVGGRPVLVFRRTSRNCEAGGPWRVRLDRRTRAERRLDWS